MMSKTDEGFLASILVNGSFTPSPPLHLPQGDVRPEVVGWLLNVPATY